MVAPWGFETADLIVSPYDPVGQWRARLDSWPSIRSRDADGSLGPAATAPAARMWPRGPLVVQTPEREDVSAAHSTDRQPPPEPFDPL